jgi:hypothetical protein
MPDGTPWRGFAEPEHRDKRCSPADGLRFAALAPVCAWCKRKALRGFRWCDRHKPGPAGERRQVRRRAGAKVPELRHGNADAHLALDPRLAALVAWPPVARMMGERAYRRPAGGLSGLVAALALSALGDSEALPAAMRDLRAAGCLRDSDPPLTWSPSPDGGEEDFEAFDPFEGAPPGG